MQKVSDNVYVETYIRGCNPGFVTTSEGVVLIDTPQTPLDAVRWREEIMRHGAPLYIINTEPHADHVTGNFYFPMAKVISHQGVRDRVVNAFPSMDELRERVSQADPQSLWLLHDYEVRPPEITFSRSMTLRVGQHTFHLANLPGHTPMEVCVHIPRERVAFTGDNVFHRTQTFLHEAVPDRWLESLEKIGELDVDVIVPGHGEVCDKGYLEEQAAVIRDWLDAVKEAKERGLTPEQAARELHLKTNYPMGQGLHEMEDWLREMNVNNLWQKV
ncbi:MAG: MBL fold metallo-hydrolase [Nitrospinota bacterium]